MKPKLLFILTLKTLILLTTTAKGILTWTATDNGSDLTLTTSGSLNIGGTTGSGLLSVATEPYGQVGFSSLGAIFATPTITDVIMYSFPAGLNSNTPNFSSSSTTISTPIVSGDTFIHDGQNIRWAASLGTSPGVISPTTQIVFEGSTVSSMFGSALDSGPIQLWRHNDTNDTIMLAKGTPIPEPSSSFLISIAFYSLLIARRR